MTGNLTSWIKQYFSVEESTVVVLRSNSGRPEEEYQGTCVPLVVTSVTKCPRPVKPLPGFRIPCIGTEWKSLSEGQVPYFKEYTSMSGS